MDVLAVGGTGFVGTHLCRELVDRGHDVTALSRSPDDAPAGVETATGDVTAYDSVEGAFEGRDAVVNLVALSPLFKPDGGDEMHDHVHRRGTEHCVRAAETHDVERLVQLSALGADPAGATAYIRAKGRAEEIVRGSDLDWTIFRPSVVFGEGGEFVSFTKRLKGMFAPGVPVYPLPGGGETRFQPIWSATSSRRSRLPSRAATRARLRTRRTGDADAPRGGPARLRLRGPVGDRRRPADGARRRRPVGDGRGAGDAHGKGPVPVAEVRQHHV
jgi:Nucleoside-diphosphate-sugar epimerases